MVEAILKFSVRNGNNLRHSDRLREEEGYTRIITRRRAGGYTVVLHFVGRQADIRACENWEVTEMPRIINQPQNEFHFRCEPTTARPTADRFEKRNGEISFESKTRKNGGGRNCIADCRRKPVSV